jgi:hypothetical protein
MQLYNVGHMSNTTTKKRKLSNFELSPAARAAIKRIQSLKGWTKTLVVETAVTVFETAIDGTHAQRKEKL